MNALGKTTLPERAVDTWVAAYLASQLPGVSLWAPTQRTQVDFDLSVFTDGKLFVLEQKAPIHGLRQGDHHIQVDVGHSLQLWRYCTDQRLAGLVWYVLPLPPYPAAYAAGRGASLMPDLARARVAGHRWPHRLPCEDWFHMVPARDLYTWLHGRRGRGFMPPLPPIGAPPPTPPPKLVGKRSFPANDLVSGGPQNATTLRQWIASVKQCSIEGGLVKDGRIVRIGRHARGREIIDEGREVSIPVDASSDGAPAGDPDADAPKSSRSPGSTRVVFVGRDDIPGWT